MWLFYFLIFISVLFGLVQNTSAKKRYVVFIFFILGAMMMFRAWTVGNDTDSYIELFKLFSSAQNIQTLSTRYEIGYILLNKGLSYISTNPQILFIVTGCFVAISFGRYIIKYSQKPWLSVIIFLCLGYFDLAMSGVRQILAVSVLLFAYDMVVKRKPIKFTLLCLLAASFHTSAILFLIVYPLSKLTVNKKLIFFTSFVGIIAYISFDKIILVIVEKLFPAYMNYFTNESGHSYSTDPKLATSLMLALWLILFLIAYNCGRNKNRLGNNINFTEQSNMITNIEAICVLLSIIMLLWSLQGTILTRFKYVFSFVLLSYYPNALTKLEDRQMQDFIAFGSLIVFVIYATIIYVFRSEWQSTYPYSFCW